MEATTLHMAAAGGHANIVKILLENGAKAEEENAVSYFKLSLQLFRNFILKCAYFKKIFSSMGFIC